MDPNVTRVRFTSDRSTAATIVCTDDLIGVDTALATLCEHQILGVAAFWEPEASMDEYEPISLLAVSAGAVTVIFRVAVPESLPMGLQLLLTHQDYVKVVCGVQEGTVGKLWRDFGIEMSPLHDCRTVMEIDYETTELYQAFRRICPGSLYKHKPTTEVSEWNQPQLSARQISHAAFGAWATRFLWLTLAKPQGFPPRARTQPVDVPAICDALTCPFCQARLHGPLAMQNHILSEHSFNCELCGFVARSAGELDTHMAMNHVRCPECGLWVLNQDAMSIHEAEFHTWHCITPGCNKVFRSEEAMYDYMREFHSQCPICDQWFLTQALLQKHMDTTHPMCAFCSRAFPTVRALKQHQYARVNGLCPPGGDVCPPARATTKTKSKIASTLEASSSSSLATALPPGTRSRAQRTAAVAAHASFAPADSIMPQQQSSYADSISAGADLSDVMPPPRAADGSTVLEPPAPPPAPGPSVNRSLQGSRYRGMAHGSGRQGNMSRPTHLDEPAATSYPTTATAATLNASAMVGELQNETLRNLTLDQVPVAAQLARIDSSSGNGNGGKITAPRTPAQTGMSMAPGMVTSTPRRPNPHAYSQQQQQQQHETVLLPGQQVPSTPSARGNLGRFNRSLFTSPDADQTRRRDVTESFQQAGAAGRSVSFAQDLTRYEQPSYYQQQQQQQQRSFVDGYGHGLDGASTMVGESTLGLDVTAPSAYGGGGGGGGVDYTLDTSDNNNLSRMSRSGNVSLRRTDRYATRTPQKDPGDERWHDPPYQRNTPLKLAKSADEVGLVGG